MTTEPLPESGANDGPEAVLGFRELSERVVASVYERFPWLQRVLLGMLAVFTGICVVATVVQLSPLPLIPIPFFLAGGYALWQLRGVRDRRQLLPRVMLFALTTMVGFWLISVVARWVE